VADGAELLVITPTAARVFEAHVPAGVPVRAGMRATLALEGEPAREGVVQRVLPAAGAGDQSVLVWIAPTGPGGVPALERAGTATVRLGSRHAALAVPEAAIAEDDLTGEHQVAAVDDSSRARWIPVTTGGAQEGWREIRGDAVRPGMRVILEGQHGLPDHTRVKPGP
jgi:multidrug efflux pump subunit AcrA (membrane-fusion protein)